MTEIYFRADANSTIATGHIMRCLTIARACTQTGRLQDKFVQVSFIVSDDESRSLLEARFEKPGEFSVFSLNSDYRRMEAEIPDLLSHITGRKAKSTLLILLVQSPGSLWTLTTLLPATFMHCPHTVKSPIWTT